MGPSPAALHVLQGLLKKITDVRRATNIVLPRNQETNAERGKFVKISTGD